MTIDDLRRRVGAILAAEEKEPTDWAHVKRLIDELEEQLKGDSDCPEVVSHYLSDADIRAQDGAYAERQRGAVRLFVDTGEHSEGTDISPWTCAFVVALILGLLLWLVL